jgi:predicted amino acid dehydrogenase
MLNVDPLVLKRVIHPEVIRAALPNNIGGVGFVFHATDWETLSFIFKRVHPRTTVFEQQLWEHPPFIGSPIYQGTQIIGANIVCPVPLELWLGSPSGIRRFRERQFFPALKLAQQAGLSMLAMGASTPYACNYGMLPRDKDSPRITTGHAATAAMLKEWTMHCCDHVGLNFFEANIALFGAAGRLGVTVAQYLAYQESPKELILIDLPDKMPLLKKQAAALLAHPLITNKLKISLHTFSPESPLPAFDGAILVSCTSTPFLKASDLRKAKFWIDDSHPRAASVAAEEAARDATLYIECFARGPAGLDTDFSFRLPTVQDCYTCFAEGYAAWREGIQDDFVTGIPALEKVAYTHRILKQYGFAVGPFVGKNGMPLPTDLPRKIA